MSNQALEALFPELSDRLKRLHNECASLLALSLEKQDVLVAGDDHEKLRGIVAREEAQAEVVAALEKERMDTAARIAAICGINDKPATVSALAQYAGETMGAKLLGEASRLNGCLERLREVNAINRDLLEMKMSYVSFMLDVFKEDRQGQSNLYGANGLEDRYDTDIISILDSEI